MDAFLVKMFKFCLVGGSGAVIDFGITFLLKEKVKIHRYLANAAGFATAASSNFFLNRYWTFESHHPEILKQYGFFLLFSMIGLGINTTFLYIFEKQKFNFYVAKIFAIAVTMLWNFFSNYFVTFQVN